MAKQEPESSPGSRNIEIVKLVFEAFARRDVEAALEWIHPQVRLWLVTAAVARGGSPYVGHDGIREYWRDVEQLWHELELLPLEFEQLERTVVALGEVRARGAAGALRQPAVWTWKLSNELVVDVRVDSDEGAARDALGEAQEIETILRAYHDAFNRRDADAMIALTDPAIVSHPAMISHARRTYIGHQGLRNWMRDVLTAKHGHTVSTNEVRKLDRNSWAVLGKVTIDETPVSPFAALSSINHGLITEVRELLSEESILRELGYLQ